MNRPSEHCLRRVLPELAGLKAYERADDDGGGRVLEGYGVVYWRDGDPGTEYWLWDDVVERIMPGAAKRAVAEDDVRGLANHEWGQLLGRAKAGTLRMFDDTRGVRYEIDVDPESGRANDTWLAVKRGDMDGSSFTFATSGPPSLVKRGRVAWIEEQRDGRTVYVRQVEDLTMFDIGPVSWPAYEGTTAGARAQQLADVERRSLEAELEQFKRARSAGYEALAIEIGARVAQVETELLD